MVSLNRRGKETKAGLGQAPDRATTKALAETGGDQRAETERAKKKNTELDNAEPQA